MAKQIKADVVGCGYWGPDPVRNFRSLPDCSMKMMCDASKSRLMHLKSLHPEVEDGMNYDHMTGAPARTADLSNKLGDW
ncbi:MAG: hypothetical protein WAO21_03060 [Verrucomicrobiia bacterium]